VKRARSLPGFLDVRYSCVRLPKMVGKRGSSSCTLGFLVRLLCIKITLHDFSFLIEIVY
jgi:hypothetical protein